PLNYDLQKDFEPIGLLSVNPQLIIGRKALPADDLKGLGGWMRANPGKATFANQNAAAQTAGVLLQQLTCNSVLFVPYRGAGPATQDLVAGHTCVGGVRAPPPPGGGGARRPTSRGRRRGGAAPPWCRASRLRTRA